MMQKSLMKLSLIAFATCFCLSAKPVQAEQNDEVAMAKCTKETIATTQNNVVANGNDCGCEKKPCPCPAKCPEKCEKKCPCSKPECKKKCVCPPKCEKKCSPCPSKCDEKSSCSSSNGAMKARKSAAKSVVEGE
jgi:hypothetical protein